MRTTLPFDLIEDIIERDDLISLVPDFDIEINGIVNDDGVKKTRLDRFLALEISDGDTSHIVTPRRCTRQELYHS